MKKLIMICIASMLTLIVSAPLANAAPTLIDFEAYTDGQNLHGVNLGGVTLTDPGGIVEVWANNRGGAGYHSPVNSVGNPRSTLLVGTFDLPMRFVSLWGGDAGLGDTDSWTLSVYDAAVGGILLGSVSSGDWDGDPYVELIISAPGIMRFEAVNSGLIAYDDLSFDVIPAPGAILLGSIGAVLVGWLRRRRTL